MKCHYTNQKSKMCQRVRLYRTTNQRRESLSKSKHMRSHQLCRSSSNAVSVDTLFEIIKQREKYIYKNIIEISETKQLFTYLGFADDDVAEYRNDDQDAKWNLIQNQILTFKNRTACKTFFYDCNILPVRVWSM